ncbi:MAG: hypothetical protein ABIG20_05390 [archaeon]
MGKKKPAITHCRECGGKLRGPNILGRLGCPSCHNVYDSETGELIKRAGEDSRRPDLRREYGSKKDQKAVREQEKREEEEARKRGEPEFIVQEGSKPVQSEREGLLIVFCPRCHFQIRIEKRGRPKEKVRCSMCEYVFKRQG